jgi:hypothetical protein
MVRVIASLFILSAASSCGQKCQVELETFYAHPAETRMSLFQIMDLSEQYMVYLCGMRYVHPPPVGLSHYIAAKNQHAGLFALERLKQSSDPVERLAALGLLVEASKLNPEQICHRSDVGQTIRAKGKQFARADLRAEYEEVAKGYCSGVDGR